MPSQNVLPKPGLLFILILINSPPLICRPLPGSNEQNINKYLLCDWEAMF